MKKEILLSVLGLVTIFAAFSTPVAQAAEKTYTNSIGMEFVLIPAGKFIMGAGENDKYAEENEKPAHQVTISKPFYLGKYEVTQAQWTEVMRSNPNNYKDRNDPVVKVSWNEAQKFINQLNQNEEHKRYRLPTEAEWEYAARAGSKTMYSFGNDAERLDEYAWYGGNSGGASHPVGQKKPNAWGLYDMHGNVYEWVQDLYEENYYRNSSSLDPHGPDSGSPWVNPDEMLNFKLHRMIRGGSWLGDDVGMFICRSAHRLHLAAAGGGRNIGFRLALSPE
jgi:formylglycine-generating enzyme required for sulfatase activity